MFAYINACLQQCSVFSQLKHLELYFDQSSMLTKGILQKVLCATQLECLKLHGGLISDDFTYFPYETFRSLKCLPNLSELLISGPFDSKFLGRLLRTPFLTTLEKLTIQTEADTDMRSWIADRIEIIKNKAPDMQLEIECKSLYCEKIPDAMLTRAISPASASDFFD